MLTVKALHKTVHQIIQCFTASVPTAISYNSTDYLLVIIPIH